MRTPFLAGIVMSMAMVAPALAQPGPAITTVKPAPTAGSNEQTSGGGFAVRDQVKHDLEQAGFTNVRIMPESFLVRANDKEGHPVMMVINPDSVMAVTNLGAASSGAHAPSSQSTINSGANAGGNSLASGTSGSQTGSHWTPSTSSSSSASTNGTAGSSQHGGTLSR